MLSEEARARAADRGVAGAPGRSGRGRMKGPVPESFSGLHRWWQFFSLLSRATHQVPVIAPTSSAQPFSHRTNRLALRRRWSLVKMRMTREGCSENRDVLRRTKRARSHGRPSVGALHGLASILSLHDLEHVGRSSPDIALQRCRFFFHLQAGCSSEGTTSWSRPGFRFFFPLLSRSGLSVRRCAECRINPTSDPDLFRPSR